MWFSSPHGDFSFSINTGYLSICNPLVFVPSRGFLFFYAVYMALVKALKKFSSPHGDFSFSIERSVNYDYWNMWFSSPHGDFSFSISWLLCLESFLYGFRPLTGISLFLSITAKMHKYIKGFRPLTGISLFLLAEKKQYNVEVTVFVPSRGFLFFYS